MLRHTVRRAALALLIAAVAWAAQAGGLLAHAPSTPATHAVVDGGTPIYPPPPQ